MINQFIQGLYVSNFTLPKEEEVYNQLLQYAEHYSICSQVYHFLRKEEQLENTPPFFQKKLKQKYNEALYQNLLIKNQTDQILMKLEELCIDVIPLKGVYFAEHYFGHVGARWTSDIDLLVREKDLEKVIDCVKVLGFDMEEEYIPSHFHCSFSKSVPGSPIPLTVEIHWNILTDTTSSLKVEKLWNEAVSFKESNYIKILSEYHTFYLICLHGWRHNLDSPKYFIDIIQMIFHRKDSVDYERLLQDAKEDKTLKRIIKTISKVYREFPFLHGIKEFPYFQSKRSSPVIRNKNLTMYFDFIDYQFFSYDKFTHIMSELFRWIFPKERDIFSQLHHEGKNRGYIINLLRLYKQRLSSACKASISLLKGV